MAPMQISCKHVPLGSRMCPECQKAGGYEFAKTEGVRHLMTERFPALWSGGTLKRLIQEQEQEDDMARKTKGGGKKC